APFHHHHHQRDHAEGRQEAREQIAEQRLLDGVDERHGAGVRGADAPLRPAVAGHDRLHDAAHVREQVAVVEAGERGRAGRHPPQLAAIVHAHEPHIGELRQAGLELPGEHGLAGSGPGAGRGGRLRHE
ncbi:MAG: hypothetical protein ACK55I_10580, partial [bacterium]